MFTVRHKTNTWINFTLQRAIILHKQANCLPTSNLVLMTVTGMRHTPLNDRANMPRNMASSGPGSPDVKFDFNQWREEKYRPTPGTQRVID